jgi:hypothetical protein
MSAPLSFAVLTVSKSTGVDNFNSREVNALSARDAGRKNACPRFLPDGSGDGGTFQIFFLYRELSGLSREDMNESVIAGDIRPKGFAKRPSRPDARPVRVILKKTGHTGFVALF